MAALLRDSGGVLPPAALEARRMTKASVALALVVVLAGVAGAGASLTISGRGTTRSTGETHVSPSRRRRPHGRRTRGFPAASRERALALDDDLALRRAEQAYAVARATPRGLDNGARQARVRATAELALADAAAVGVGGAVVAGRQPARRPRRHRRRRRRRVGGGAPGGRALRGGDPRRRGERGREVQPRAPAPPDPGRRDARGNRQRRGRPRRVASRRGIGHAGIGVLSPMVAALLFLTPLRAPRVPRGARSPARRARGRAPATPSVGHARVASGAAALDHRASGARGRRLPRLRARGRPAGARAHRVAPRPDRVGGRVRGRRVAVDARRRRADRRRHGSSAPARSSARLRPAVADVPAGISGLTDRVLPYLFPTLDRSALPGDAPQERPLGVAATTAGRHGRHRLRGARRARARRLLLRTGEATHLRARHRRRDARFGGRGDRRRPATVARSAALARVDPRRGTVRERARCSTARSAVASS